VGDTKLTDLKGLIEKKLIKVRQDEKGVLFFPLQYFFLYALCFHKTGGDVAGSFSMCKWNRSNHANKEGETPNFHLGVLIVLEV
jgi:hypothetical protein